MHPVRTMVRTRSYRHTGRTHVRTYESIRSKNKMSKRHSARLSETPNNDNDDNIGNFANKRRVRTELEMQNTTNAAALKKKFTEAPYVAETEKVTILADALSNMEKSIQTSINRFESGLKEDLRKIIREELGVVIKNQTEKEMKNLKIIYKQN